MTQMKNAGTPNYSEILDVWAYILDTAIREHKKRLGCTHVEKGINYAECLDCGIHVRVDSYNNLLKVVDGKVERCRGF